MAELNIADLEDDLKAMQKLKDSVGELRALRNLGYALQKNRQFTKAASCFSKALNSTRDNGSDEEKAVIHASLGCVYWEMAQLKKAEAHFQSALEIQKQTQDSARSGRCPDPDGYFPLAQMSMEEGLAFFSEGPKTPPNRFTANCT